VSGVLQVVVGGMFGSEAKGAVSAYLSRPEEEPGRQVYGVRVGGSNAGHTVYGTCPGASGKCIDCAGLLTVGHPWRLRHVPVAAVSNPDAILVLAQGSEVDPVVLAAEVAELESAGYKVAHRLHVDATATVIEPRHLKVEAQGDLGRLFERDAGADLVSRIGSTGKGVGAARADRAVRRAMLYGHLPSIDRLGPGSVTDTVELLRAGLADGGSVVVEGVQGYGLGQHAGHYPYVTSSDCRAIDFLSMAGLSPWADEVEVFVPWVVVRTRPIRVAGNSGPLKDERTWEELGLAPEYTTVTRKVRRVGEWDGDLVKRAIAANGGSGVVGLAVTMLDQLFPETEKVTAPHNLSERAVGWLYQVERELGVAPTLVGTSPTTLIDTR
jgi:adenylosuccinate synthase